MVSGLGFRGPKGFRAKVRTKLVAVRLFLKKINPKPLNYIELRTAPQPTTS